MNKEKFEEASNIEKVHTNGAIKEIFSHGFKMTLNTDTEECEIYNITSKNYVNVKENEVELKMFTELPFKYVTDLFFIKSNIEALLNLEKVVVNREGKSYVESKNTYVDRLNSALYGINLKK